MSTRFQVLVALWFVAQITFPFTAPLQTVALSDLFGQRPHPQAGQVMPELCSVPTPARRPTILAQLKVTPIRMAAPALTSPSQRATGASATSAFAVTISLRLPLTVLRL